MAHKVCLIRGDGTGPEIVAAVQTVLNAAKVDIDWIEWKPASNAWKRANRLFPMRRSAKSRRSGLGLKGPMTTPVAWAESYLPT